MNQLAHHPSKASAMDELPVLAVKKQEPVQCNLSQLNIMATIGKFYLIYIVSRSHNTSFLLYVQERVLLGPTRDFAPLHDNCFRRRLTNSRFSRVRRFCAGVYSLQCNVDTHTNKNVDYARSNSYMLIGTKSFC